MAATRLIPLHVNKGKTVAKCLADRTDYSQNAEKTDGGKYISSYECDPHTADEEFLLSKRQYEHNTGRKQEHDVIAYQIRQSFKPGEVTPELANQIGYELAMRFTKGKHAFIVATHVDRAHIHNHIIYNSTALDCNRKFKNFFLSSLAVARISDRLCLENGLSVIIPKPYRERKKRTDYPKKESRRDEIYEAIDAAMLKKPKDFDALVQLLVEDGFSYKAGKNPALKGKTQKRFIRFRSLTDGYKVEDLTAVLAGEKEHSSRAKKDRKSSQPHEKDQMQFLIDVQSKVLAGKGAGYERWAKVFNLKQMAQALIFMQEHGIESYEELAAKTAASTEKCDGLLVSIKADETRLQEIAVLKTHIINYAKAKDTFAAYKASGYSRKFFEEHREVLTLRKAAKQAFDEYKKEKGEKAAIPRVKELSAEYAEVLARKKKSYADYRKEKSELQEYLVAQKIVQTLMSEELQKEEAQQWDQNEQTHGENR